MKGTVFGGILWLPSHPDADMHGLLRVVVHTASRLTLQNTLSRYGFVLPPVLFSAGLWSESESIVEQRAAETRYGEVLTCPLSEQYRDISSYRPLSGDFLTRKAP